MKKSTLKKISLSLGALTLVSTPILSTIACGGGGSSKPVIENQELKSFVNDQVKSYVSDLSAENALKMLAGPDSKINGNMQQLIPHTITFEGKSIDSSFVYQINLTHLLIGTNTNGLLQVTLDGNGKIIKDSIVKYNDTTGKLPSSFFSCFAIKINDTHLFIYTQGNGLFQVELNSNNYLIKNVIQFPLGTADTGELPNDILNAIKIDDSHLIVSSRTNLYEVSLSNGMISSCSKYPSFTMVGSFSANPILLSKNKILFSYFNGVDTVYGILSIDSNGRISKIDPYTYPSGFDNGVLSYLKIKSTYFFYYLLPGVPSAYNKIILGDISTEGMLNSYGTDLILTDGQKITNIVQIKSNLTFVATTNGGAKLIKIDPTTGLPISNEIISFPIQEGDAIYGTLSRWINGSSIQCINSHVIIGGNEDLYDCLINPFDSNVAITSSTEGTTQKLTFHMDGYSDETLSWTTS